ncbi:MAG: CooT family nickel-binding protein [Spirochaetaceae bacterium]|jgi:predicted RNA-binding protein|nr:CooT family nickel-binding protein [Spirochaetaceae bacterium]
MCLSTVYELGAQGDKRLICEHTSSLRVQGDRIVLVDLMGSEVSVPGTVQSVDLVKNTIFISPAVVP